MYAYNGITYALCNIQVQIMIKEDQTGIHWNYS
jgi:hypothetical protein